jgi:nucleotide-binding universal stress UspA family protein
MYKHLLIATDGSETGHIAVGQGLSFARALGADATVVTVSQPWVGHNASSLSSRLPAEDYEKHTEANASRILAGAVETARKVGIACNTLHVRNSHASDGIIEAAQNLGCDLIVMASHGRRGLAGILVGSETNRVITESKIPVLVCR